MDDFVQDPDLGPELFRFVSQKWKATREVLKASQDHNARLREEIQDLRNGGRESLVKEEVEPVNAEDDWEEDEQSRLLDITCRIGQCRPKNEAVSLAEKLKEANERIEALEQALQESVVNLEEMQKRYEQVKTKSKARRADILELRGRVQELEALQAPETLHVHAKQEEQAASLGASENPRTEDAAEETIVVSESRPAVTIPLDWVTQPCLRGGLRIFDVPKVSIHCKIYCIL
ncbi:hypothetical protein BC835DRAFT_1368183 [Cytidiella melzeri]|nr:hypothetical protein BC835DRAFT_1368183 [Cytidiella melzeri]